MRNSPRPTWARFCVARCETNSRRRQKPRPEPIPARGTPISELIIYGHPGSTFVRTVRMACIEKGVPCTLDAFESFRYRSDTHRELHPFAKMPILRHDDLVLFETVAICNYIDEAFEGPRLVPEKLAERCLMYQWISLISDDVYERLVRRWLLPALRGADMSRNEIRKAKAGARETLVALNGMLQGADTLVGTTVTTADLFLAPILAYSERHSGEILEGLKELGRVWSEISSRESFVKTM